MMTANITDSLASNRFGLQAGRNDHPMPTAPKPAIAPATGVRKPITSPAPEARPATPITHTAGVEIPLDSK